MNGDLQVEKEPAKDNSRKGVVPDWENSKGKVPEAGKSLAWRRTRGEINPAGI